MVRDLVTKQFSGKEYFGHPAGLFALFLTEMWERFSYYGMRALLILYLTNYLLADPARAAEVWGYNALHNWLVNLFGDLSVQQASSHIYGLYTGFVYFTPFFGGLLADKILGQYRTVYLGAILMAIGHFLMASERFFLIALLFLIVGNGAFKPNIGTQVGNLYKPGDQRRDSAFIIFYMGVNLGAFFSPLVCGTLGQAVGWHYGFGAAGVGMLIGLVVYYLTSGLVPKDVLKKGEKKKKVPLTAKEWKVVAALVVICILNIVFWGIYEQQGNTLQLWADQKTDWTFFGIQLPSSWFQAFNPAMIFLFSPLLIQFWAWQRKRKKEPSSVVKMGIGCALCGAAYIFMILAAKAVPGADKASILWLVATVFIFTIGELYLSPVGLSLFTKAAPPSIVSTMIGVFYLSSFFGNYMTGFLGTFYEKMPKDAFFAMLAVMGIATGIVFRLIYRPLEKTVGKHL